MTTSFSGLGLLGRRQDGVVTRAQLADVGADKEMITRRELARMWRTLGPRVVALHHGELGRDARWWAGVLHASLDDDGGPGRVALSGLSAMEAGGLTGSRLTRSTWWSSTGARSTTSPFRA